MMASIFSKRLSDFIFLVLVHLCVSACVCVHDVYTYICAHANGGQKRTSDPLELEVQVGMSHPVSVLGPEL